MTGTRYGGFAHRPTPSAVGTAAALLLASLTWVVLTTGPASAEYPDRLVRLVVPQAPGSATDVLARILAAELEPQIGQSIVVENRPGGALTTGLAFTAKSAPDGYTIAMGPIGALAITRHLVKKVPYDIERDFQPIAPRRSPAFPDLPTIDEAGVPGFEVTTWNGVIGPSGMPRPVVDKLNAAINGAVRTRGFEQRLAALGQEVAGGTPEDFAEAIRRDSAKWLDVIRRSGIKLD